VDAADRWLDRLEASKLLAERGWRRAAAVNVAEVAASDGDPELEILSAGYT
jgi:hypothetical protein